MKCAMKLKKLRDVPSILLSISWKLLLIFTKGKTTSIWPPSLMLEAQTVISDIRRAMSQRLATWLISPEPVMDGEDGNGGSCQTYN